MVGKQAKRIATLERMDREAATYVEMPICMRTHFTGEPPYVGWKGLGIAIEEALDELAALRAKLPARGEGGRFIRADDAPADIGRGDHLFRRCQALGAS